MLKRLSTLATLVSLAVASSVAVAAYPEKPITVVVPFAAGGPTDVVARTLSQAMSGPLKGTLVVENVGGAGGTIGAGKVARAQGDGYTLLFHHIGMSTAPALYRKLDFKPLDDFIPIGAVVDVPMTLIAKPQGPIEVGSALGDNRPSSARSVRPHGPLAPRAEGQELGDFLFGLAAAPSIPEGAPGGGARCGAIGVREGPYAKSVYLGCLVPFIPLVRELHHQ